jgi:hypothetical protein
MRQKLVTILSEDLEQYDVPQLYFDENTILIVYTEFHRDLIRYIHTPRIFIIPEQLFTKFSKSTFTVTDTKIKFDNHIIDNTNATIDGVPYFPKDFIQLDVQEKYIEEFRKYVPEQTVQSNIDNLDKAIEYLKSVKVPVDNYNNLEIRFRRLEDFGNKELADKLRRYFGVFKEDFDKAASLSLQFNDLEDISLNPVQSNTPTLYYKLNYDVGVYSWNGYSTFVDTLTRILFYTSVKDNVYTFSKCFAEFKPVVVVYGILNYNLAQDIHEKTNRNKKFYEMLLKELE